MSANDILQKIVDLDTQIATLKIEFDNQPEDEKAAVLEKYLGTLLTADFEKDEAPLALARCLDMIVSLGEDHAVRILADGMQHDNPEVRQMCGEVMFMLCEEGIAAVMPAVDMALEKGGHLAEELPFLVAEIDDPEAPRLVERFLKHDDPQVVLAAIVALVENGDDLTVDALRQLEGDTREVTLEEEGKPAAKATIGDIVREELESFELEE